MEGHKPVLIVIAGPNGSGKTTITSKIISRYIKSIRNCRTLSKVADRTYVYDNSIDYADARLLFRMIDGIVVKQYITPIPDWAKGIIEE